MTEAAEGRYSAVLQTARVVSRRAITRTSVLKRVLASFFLGYFIWILMFALGQNVGGGLFFGVYWSSGGPGTLIPLPSPPGNLAVITPAYPLDAFFYIIFISDGLWIVWISLALLYIFSPIKINLREVLNLIRESENRMYLGWLTLGLSFVFPFLLALTEDHVIVLSPLWLYEERRWHEPVLHFNSMTLLIPFWIPYVLTAYVAVKHT